MLHSLGVIGASGRLGARIVLLARERGVAVPLRASRRAGWAIEGRPAVVVDVSHRSALAEVVAYCEREEVALVSATSGHHAEDEGILEALSRRVPVLRAANLSLGHHLQTVALAAIGRCLAQRAGAVEVRVIDRHPAYKQDRPSATAIRLADLWRRQGGKPAVVASLRHGPPVSDHHIGWSFDGEELSIDHCVTDRAAAARGAIAAATWLAGRAPGVSDMTDVYQ